MAVVWDARNGTRLLELKGHTIPVNRSVFSPDGSRIATAGSTGPGRRQRGEAKVWDARFGNLLLDLKGHISRVNAVAFSPDAEYVVSGVEDRTVKVWDARAGTPRIELDHGPFELQSAMAMSPMERGSPPEARSPGCESWTRGPADWSEN